MKMCPCGKVPWEMKQNIYEFFLKEGQTKEEAMNTASMYGHTEESPKYFGINSVWMAGEARPRVVCTECQRSFPDEKDK